MIRLACALLAILGPCAAMALDIVSLARPDGETLTAAVAKPEGPGPFPAIVALHGCGGYAIARGGLAGRDKDWADRFVSAGFAVIFPDSFTARGFPRGVCTNRERPVTARQRGGDAAAAADWLAAQAWVDPKRIGLIGWSHGGSTALHAVWSARPSSTDFRVAAVFYPGCGGFRKAGWRPRVATTILHGVADDWTDIAPCDELAAATGVPIVRYPEAHHGFDAPASPLRTREAAFSKKGDGVVTTGTNQAARADAIDRVMRMFKAM